MTRSSIHKAGPRRPVSKLTQLLATVVVAGGLVGGFGAGFINTAQASSSSGVAIDWSQAPWSNIQASTDQVQPSGNLQLAQARIDKSELVRAIDVAKRPGRPDLKGCAPFRTKIKCDEDLGYYEVRLTLAGSAAFGPDDFSFRSATPGVEIFQPYPEDPLRVIVVGASPGDVIVITVDGSIEGGGSKAGTDLCCGGEIKIQIPRQLTCGEPELGEPVDPRPRPDPTPTPIPEADPEPEDPRPTDPVPPVPSQGYLGIFKSSLGECRVSRAQQSYSCDFEMSVINEGSEQYNGPAIITDHFISRSGIIDFRVISGGDWSCSAPSASQVRCINGFVSLAPAEKSTVRVRMTIPALRRNGVLTNCASTGYTGRPQSQVRMIQQVLEAYGIPSGGVDGRMGPNTRRGIRELQGRFGLATTGEISNDLLAMLGMQVQSEAFESCATVSLPPIRPPRRDDPQFDPVPPILVPPMAVPNCDTFSTVRNGRSCSCRYPNMFKVSPTQCACPRGTQLFGGIGCEPITRPEVRCDRATTFKSGNKCVCRFKNMRKISPSKCACPRGSLFIVGKGCTPRIDIPRPPKCDVLTTKKSGNKCVCRYRNMKKVSPSKCACPRNTFFVAGKGCVPKLNVPRPPKCDVLTTKKSGNKCVCRYRNMKKVSPSKCACPRNTFFVAGKGCTPKLNVPLPKKCDTLTTKKSGNKCVCRYRNMKKVSGTKCACKNGGFVVAGRGCIGGGIKPPKQPRLPQALNCDRLTTKKSGNKCVCRYRNMKKVSKTKCSCKNGGFVVAGRGCASAGAIKIPQKPQLKLPPPRGPIVVPPKRQNKIPPRGQIKSPPRNQLKVPPKRKIVRPPSQQIKQPPRQQFKVPPKKQSQRPSGQNKQKKILKINPNLKLNGAVFQQVNPR